MLSMFGTHASAGARNAAVMTPVRLVLIVQHHLHSPGGVFWPVTMRVSDSGRAGHSGKGRHATTARRRRQQRTARRRRRQPPSRGSEPSGVRGILAGGGDEPSAPSASLILPQPYESP